MRINPDQGAQQLPDSGRTGSNTAAAQLPEVREERVTSLRQAIQNGSYHPSPADVAGAMFSHLAVERAA